MIEANQFQQLILTWFDRHGRKHLPWQQNKTPYRVWISEIMLQQTQVNTVIPYFERFMNQFPNLESLAHATIDEVLHLWAGLGYYSRARNLHRASKMIIENFCGIFPNTLENLQQLPGIGQSTAGAILAIAFNQPAAILDGNVKRVLSRFEAISDPINNPAIEKNLWTLAHHYTPQTRSADYTQAMMDLGATICKRSQPLCYSCPLNSECLAHQQEITHLIPQKKKPTSKIPKRVATFIIFKHKNRILLRKRPPMGIWGGLWSFPEITGKPDKKTIQQFSKQQFHVTVANFQLLPSFVHTFSHFQLEIHPILVPVTQKTYKIMDAEQEIWYNPHTKKSIGLPKPMAMLVRKLYDTSDPLH